MGFNSGFKGLISFIKQSHYRPGQAMRVPGGCGSHILRQSAHEGSKVVSPKHRPPLPPQEIFLVLISVRSWVDPRAVSAAGRITSMKNSSDTIGKQTRDLPACSAVPQPTALPGVPIFLYCLTNAYFCISAFLVIIFMRHPIINATDLKGHQVTQQSWKKTITFTVLLFIDEGKRNEYTSLAGKPEWKRPLGRPK